MIRVLLDEDLPIRLRNYFPDGIEVETVEYRGWKGLKNGALLTAAAKAFDVLVTMDDKLSSQQNLADYDIAVVVLRAHTKRITDLQALMPEFKRRLNELRAGVTLRIFPPEHERS